MPKDNILRCLVHLILNGETTWGIMDAVEEGDCYSLVLQWSGKAGEVTEFPNKRVGIKKTAFQVISDAGAPYELRCLYSVNFDEMSFSDGAVDAEDIWRGGDKVFYPRPDENDV